MKSVEFAALTDRVKIAVLVRNAGLKQSTVLSALGMTGRKARPLSQMESRLLKIQLRKLGRDIDKLLMK